MFRRIIEALDSERQGFGIEMNQIYESKAIWADDEDSEALWIPGNEGDLHYLESTYPGFRLPHAWLRSATAAPSEPMVSTHDLAGKGSFVLFTGIGGRAKWAEAAEKVKEALNVDIKVYGIGEEYRDVFYQWIAKRQVGEKGAVLVRPDRFVAWRSDDVEAGSGDKLVAVMSRILGRGA